MNEFAYEYKERHVYKDEAYKEETGAEIISNWLKDKIFLGMTFNEYMKTLYTPINIAAGLVVFAGMFLVAMRFLFGLDQITEASNEQPWGLFLTWGLFAILPVLYFYGVQNRNVKLIQITAAFSMLAIFLNRFNLTLITFNWQLPNRELFFWKEALVVLSVVIIEVLVYRWIVNRMPVLRDHPDFVGDGH